ncbi:hypothetical protein BBP40_003827 [Aspergillus hancockii]|nr:hypothetical protein BBP40_003827 [Aspergillus hancockii]
MGNQDDQRLPTRKRKSHVNSRNGCFTCKTRRVKCDETRPYCLRCSRPGRLCEFPEPETTVPRETEVPSSLSLRIFKTPRECGYFNYFRFETVVDLSGWFSWYFWERLVLQMAHSESVVRRAAVALGALHVDGLPQVQSGENQYALQHYGEALSGLRRLLGEGSLRSMDACLTTCFLLSRFEVLRQNYDAAKMHRSNGLRILKLWKGNHDQLRLETHSQDPQTIPCYERRLVEHFPLLETQIITFLQSKPSNIQDPVLFEKSELRIPTPLEFPSLNVARETFTQLLNTSMNLTTRATNQLDFARDESKPDDQRIYPHRETYASIEYGNTLRTVISEFLLGITQWNQAFDAYLGVCSNTMTASQLRPTSALKLYSIIMYILFSRYPSLGEMGYDSFLPQFDQAISEPLYYVATKCRHRETHERALYTLLMSPYKEGLFDAAAATHVMRTLVDLEEDHRVPGTVGPEGIPQEIRVIGMNFNFDHDTGKVLLVVDRPGAREEHWVNAQ